MSTRDTVLDQVKTTLQTISTANGYNTDPAKVERKMLFWDTETSFPVLMVLGGEEEYEDTLGGETFADLHVKIRGYSQDSTDPETALCDIIADVVKAMSSSSNPYVDRTFMVRLDTDEGWFNFQEQGFGYFDLEFIIKYSFNRSNP